MFRRHKIKRLTTVIKHCITVKCYIWSMALFGAETWTLRAADQKYLGSFEMEKDGEDQLDRSCEKGRRVI